ncbi:MAG: DUF3842 family protein [Firmicutes bacterium]|nr:DUF3842 family protein [Bacillota bacterium]
MRILIIDGQGGGLGKLLVSAVKDMENVRITAVGTNSIATSAMLKAGAKEAATGENAVIVACRTADVIVGAVGIAIADSLLGEITPAMANAVGGSTAQKILIPMNKCDITICGCGGKTMAAYVAEAAELIRSMAADSQA